MDIKCTLLTSEITAEVFTTLFLAIKAMAQDIADRIVSIISSDQVVIYLGILWEERQLWNLLLLTQKIFQHYS